MLGLADMAYFATGQDFSVDLPVCIGKISLRDQIIDLDSRSVSNFGQWCQVLTDTPISKLLIAFELLFSRLFR